MKLETKCPLINLFLETAIIGITRDTDSKTEIFFFLLISSFTCPQPKHKLVRGLYFMQGWNSSFASSGTDFPEFYLLLFPCFWNFPHKVLPHSITHHTSHSSHITQFLLANQAPSLQPGEVPLLLPNGLVAPGGPNVHMTASSPLSSTFVTPLVEALPSCDGKPQNQPAPTCLKDSECSRYEFPSQAPEKALAAFVESLQLQEAGPHYVLLCFKGANRNREGPKELSPGQSQPTRALGPRIFPPKPALPPRPTPTTPQVKLIISITSSPPIAWAAGSLSPGYAELHYHRHKTSASCTHVHSPGGTRTSGNPCRLPPAAPA